MDSVERRDRMLRLLRRRGDWTTAADELISILRETKTVTAASSE